MHNTCCLTNVFHSESVAFSKICKIHRKLPQGAILVFLTGKGEIIRMVNKLRKALNPSSKRQQRFTGSHDVNEQMGLGDDQVPREMDDEELDADDNSEDDFDTMDDDDVVAPINNTDEDNEEDNIPKKAYVLPLYSLLSTEEQAKVFAPVPEGHRLIVVATNIAETSITIPGISYVVDTGRQKCRNFNSGTGVASYDVMWISKAAADQRAGRAGRTGPGHCYRLYSSSLYSRYMDSFALPEVLTRPLEDVVLSMKALNVSNVSSFPFPTPPDRKQIDAAVKLLANIGCVDLSNVEDDGGDGVATRLGQAVAKLPLGVRYAKMLLVAAQAGVLDYAIVLVSVLSENSPFQHSASQEDQDDSKEDSDDESMDEIDKAKAKSIAKQEKKNKKRWQHRNGDILASMLAVGAYTYAGKGAGGATEQLAARKFCEENGLSHVTMGRIQKMRKHLASLAKHRLSTASGIAAKTGGFSSKMTPPNQLQERLLVQAIASGLLDNIALLAPPGSISGEHPFGVRSAYLSCSTLSNDPLYLDRNSTLFERDFRQLPKWVCYDCIILKTLKDGSSVKVMQNITPVDPSWLGELAKGTKLLSLGGPIVSPLPSFDIEKDAVVCPVLTKFGSHGWEIQPIKQEMFACLQSPEAKQNPDFLLDDSFRWFAKFLLEGKVIRELQPLGDLLNDRPTLVTRRTPVAKVSLLVSALANAGIDSASALRKHWAEKDDKFLFKHLKNWVKPDCQSEAKKLWIQVVKQNIKIWNTRND
jgi:ATP-dependent RNA helicase DHX37/DHR1